jgi:hypothetical protein
MMATLTMLVKYASDIGVALPEIMFWRQAVTVPVVLLGLWMTSGLARLRTNRLRSHGLRAFTGMCGMLCGFGAATLLPLRLFGPPLALPVVRTMMTWHARMNEDPAHAWLRDVTQRCTTAVLTASPRAPAAGEPLGGRGGSRARAAR